jgi:hypothetical protein
MQWVIDAVVAAVPVLESIADEVEEAPDLARVVGAAWRLAFALGALIVAAELTRRSQVPVEWPCCPRCGARLQSKGWVPREILTALGMVRWTRRVGRCPNGCAVAQWAPVDHALGLEPGQRTSWELQRLGCVLAVFLPFGVTGHLLKVLLGIEVTAGAVWAWVQKAGGRAKVRLDQELTSLALGEEPAQETLPVEAARLPLILGGDGVMLPFRRHPKTPKGKTRWREVKVGVVARLGKRITRKGKNVSRLVQRRLVAVCGKPADLKIRLQLEGLRQGMRSAPQVAWISDGGRWLWRIYRAAFAQAVGILDFYHVVENVWKRIEPCFGSKARQARSYLKVARSRLRRGDSDEVLTDLMRAAAVEGLPKKAVREIQRLHRYLGQHRDHMDYARYKQLGLPLGSGMVESACKWLIQQRFKGVGMRWSDEGFTTLLHLRLAWVNSRFDDLFIPYAASPIT